MLNGVGSYVRNHHVGLLACVLALSGSAYAASKVGPRDIAKNAVRAKHIKRHQIGTAHLRRTFEVTAEKNLPPDATAGDGNWSAEFVPTVCPKGTRAIGFSTEWVKGGGQPLAVSQVEMKGRAVSVLGTADNGATGSVVNRLRVRADCLRRGR